MKNYQITNWCHKAIRDQVKPGDFCIDATAGKGNDTQLLCSLVGDTGRVLAFDIQEAAVEATSMRLYENGYDHIGSVILDSHANLSLYAAPESVSCIVFNFGYLPGGDHSLCTHADTSIQAIETGLNLLKKDGMMSLCIYSGGDTGFEEKDAILNYMQELDSKKYVVIMSTYFNRPNNPPIPVFIYKV